MAVTLIYDSFFLMHSTGEAHPENSHRLEVVLAALKEDESLLKRIGIISPEPASDTDITRCHEEKLVHQIRAMCAQGLSFIDADTQISPESFDVAVLAAGAAVSAVDLAMKEEGGRSFSLARPPGHHATRGKAMGFCLFNNAAIAARYAQSKYGVENVLIIDWDVHHGNGTQEIFWTDRTIFYFSTHQYPFYPGTGASSERGAGRGEGFTLNVPLGAGTSSREHRRAFTDALGEIEKKFHPDLIIISAGFDSRRGDPLGGLMLEEPDFAEMTKDVLRLAEKYALGRVISLLEGGYNLLLLGGSVRSHVAALV